MVSAAVRRYIVVQLFMSVVVVVVVVVAAAAVVVVVVVVAVVYTWSRIEDFARGASAKPNMAKRDTSHSCRSNGFFLHVHVS